jgi:hypothetical protein
LNKQEALDQTLSIVQIAGGVAASVAKADSGGGEVAVIADMAVALTSIIQRALAAHVAVTGQPIDPSLLKPFEPIV